MYAIYVCSGAGACVWVAQLDDEHGSTVSGRIKWLEAAQSAHKMAAHASHCSSIHIFV